MNDGVTEAMNKTTKARTKANSPFGDDELGGFPMNVFGPGFPFNHAQFPFHDLIKNANIPSILKAPSWKGPTKKEAEPPKEPAPEKPKNPPPQDGNLWQRIGGLDGIITHMGKVQKIMQMAQQMSPLMKLFTNSLLPPASPTRATGRLPSSKRRRRRRT